MSTTGYILAPNIANGKVAIKSMMSSPNISFETLIDPINIQPNVNIKIDNKKKKKKNKMNSSNKIEKLLGKKITKEDIKNNKKLKRKLLKEYNSK